MKLVQRNILLPCLISRLSGGENLRMRLASYLLPTCVVCVASYMRQTLCHSLVLKNEATVVIECENWQVVNLDNVFSIACLCVCVQGEREGAIYT